MPQLYDWQNFTPWLNWAYKKYLQDRRGTQNIALQTIPHG